nr:MAG TPA_asm: Transcription factor WhiB [Caudoviricetes sp.]
MNNPYNTQIKPLRKNWWNKAKCHGENPDNYDLGLTRAPNKDYAARKLCEGCPVIAECAADVLEHNNYGMVRAGMWFDTWAVRPSRINMKAEGIARADWQELRLHQLAAGVPPEEIKSEEKPRVTVSIAS